MKSTKILLASNREVSGMKQKKRQSRRGSTKTVKIRSSKTRAALLRVQEATAGKLADFAEAKNDTPLAEGLSIDPFDMPLVTQALNMIERIEVLCQSTGR